MTGRVPATRVTVFGDVVCADCGYQDGRHGDDCSWPTVEPVGTVVVTDAEGYVRSIEDSDA